MRLFSKRDFLSAKFDDKLLCKCDFCHEEILKTKRDLHNNDRRGRKREFCSKTCNQKSNITKVECKCQNCGIKFLKHFARIGKTKHHFCSQSCAGTYSNANRTHGYSRSKLEVWLETQLPTLFPNLEFHFNKKEAIRSELDIYIPELKLAFELNGIFHYEPIFGTDQLDKIQNNDGRKFAACLEKGIELCIIDTSGQKYFKPASSQKYLDIICQIIKIKYAVSDSN